MRMTTRLAALLATALLLITACAQLTTDGEQPSETPLPDAREIRVEAFQFGFEPATIEVTQGERIRLVLATRDVPHGLAIPEFGVNLATGEGREDSAEFVADKAGEFSFYCSIPCGSGHGKMRGTLVVR